MIKVLETFSGIGAQAKALERLKIEYEIVATADWDINAIIAYDIIHYGAQDLSAYETLTKEELVEKLEQYTLSPDGKSPYEKGSIKHQNIKVLRSLLAAIERSKNLVSITDMTYKNIPEDLGLLTYSFPCQDLSIAGLWHGNKSGIDREVKNRSGMLWEVERILKECVENKRNLPKFLLMENVSNILSALHKKNFEQWTNYLSSIGYYNKIYTLNAKNFGIPQNRTRVYMLSIYIGGDEELSKELDEYFTTHDLENVEYAKSLKSLKRLTVKDIIRDQYDEKSAYRDEANESQLNDTPSREKIVEENDHLIDEQTGECITLLKTITTKQDRNPNSGVIPYNYPREEKLEYRYLTARECFIAMGFDEEDFDVLMDNNIMMGKSRPLFSMGKLIKMAGNSIVVNVLEAIFMQVDEINKKILGE